MPGRPRKPVSILEAQGTYRKDRHAGKLQVPDAPIGEAPEWFDATMRAEWERLGAIHHIKAAHRVEVEHACVLYARFVQDAKGERDMTASERQNFHSVYMQLACTPASQAKVSAEPAPKINDPWAQLG